MILRKSVKYCSLLFYVLYAVYIAGCGGAAKDATEIDQLPPVTEVNPAPGIFSSEQSIMLSCADNASGCAETYYTLDGTDPTTQSEVFQLPLNFIVEGTTIFKYFSIDNVGNIEPITTNQYTLDLTPPELTSSQLIFISVGSTGMTVSWAKAGDNISSLLSLQYQVYYSTENNLNTVTNIELNGIPAGNLEADISSQIIVGLESVQLYYWNVIVQDEAGNKTAYSEMPQTTIALGVLDPNFGDNGIVIKDDVGGFPAVFEQASAVAIDNKGNILVVGYTPNIEAYTDMVLFRFKPDGSLDLSFNGTGMVLFDGPLLDSDDKGYGVEIDINGKIIVVGKTGLFLEPDMALWRFNEDGSLDTTFGGSGYNAYNTVNTLGNSLDIGRDLVIDGAGKILVVGYREENGVTVPDMIIWRVNPNGSLDTSFGGVGFIVSGGGSGRSIVLDKSGKILVAGGIQLGNVIGPIAIWRYHANGNLDTTFSVDGIAEFNVLGASEFATDLSIHDAGGILAVGVTTNNAGNRDAFVLRCYSDGILDTTFGGSGIVVYDSGNYDLANSLKIDKAGNIVSAGYTNGIGGGINSDMAIWRYKPNGTLDTSFNGSGIVVSDASGGVTGRDIAYELEIDNLGKLITVGQNAPNERDFTAIVLWRFE